MLNYLRWILSRVRYHIRRQTVVSATAYGIPNFWYALRGGWRAGTEEAGSSGPVAVCLRFRDEALFLKEWLDYYIAAGVSHFFLYNNNSADDYMGVLAPYIESGAVTLIDWPRVPASPDAENDCIHRTSGRFSWVGFLDADEFVVIKDGRRIDQFLSSLPKEVPALALHWYYFGSNGHDRRPADRVVSAYTKRSVEPNAHFKVFVRPKRVTRNRNSHNFYYVRGECAVREDGSRAYGSMANPPLAKAAWINHYYCKSMEDYLQKAARKSTLDKSGISDPSRTMENARIAMAKSNEVSDMSAITYFQNLAGADFLGGNR